MTEIFAAQLHTLAAKYGNVVVITGAGVSTPSGLPDFTEKEQIWDESVPREIALSLTFFHQEPAEFWRLYKKIFFRPQKPEPSAAHHYLANLEQEIDVTIFTQNVDGLHKAAGSKNVYEVHGNASLMKCLACSQQVNITEVINTIIPHCICGGRLKPDIVLYEEPVNYEELNELLLFPGVLLMMGTSLTVAPICNIPFMAATYYPHLMRIYWDKNATPEHIPLFHAIMTTDFRELDNSSQ